MGTVPVRSRHPVWRKLGRNLSVKTGATLLFVLVMLALLAPVLAPEAPNTQNWFNRLKPPNPSAWLGTDDFGRSVLSRILHGGRVSLLSGVLPVLLGAGVGTLLGLLAGYIGRTADTLIMRVMDVLLAFPGLLLALAILGTLGPGFQNAVLAIGIGLMPTFARLVRAEVLQVKQGEFVEAAHALGAPHPRVLLRHVLPNVASPLIVQATVSVGYAILAAAGLSFLGLGVQPPVSDWGEMLSSGRRFLPQAWWLEVFPGVMIALTVLSINLLGDGLRDALDPRTK
ncbi:ABC transporter permease [Deinococcus aquatilis]|jgi:peptide/nickel transport system permease protein|uniref:ABC transporter permease n=1 Tax=Deinococcus aquatilis TaxID=519440 RepID=UPI00037706F8|nr:ABC transporter permease [Deinococcus aquatilis]